MAMNQRKRNWARVNEGLRILDQDDLTATLLGDDAAHLSITKIIKRSEAQMHQSTNQAKMVRLMYDFLPEATWGMFFGEDPITQINDEPVDPFFSSIHFVMDTICHKLSDLTQDNAEVMVCTDYMRRCHLLAAMQRCVRKIILIRRFCVAVNLWQPLWFPYGIRPISKRV